MAAAPAISTAHSPITASRCKACARNAIASSTGPGPTSLKRIWRRCARLTIRGHITEKGGILACLLVAEMIAARGASIGDQIRAMYKKLGREFWPVRENLHLSDEQKANAVKRVAVDASTLVGRKVISIDRTDGAKFVFDDGSWMLLRLSGTEPLLRLYVEAESAAASAKLTREASRWVLQN